ncbi:MAG: epoxyqueuosine reductase QueH [Candidatus Thermoplasmatota archaeon]
MVHICCAPCFTFVNKKLEEHKIIGYFYNPNIYPKWEYENRLESLREYNKIVGGDMIFDSGDQNEYLNGIFGNPKRCEFCYWYRLDKTAEKAKENGCDAFTSTIFISPYQKHELAKEVCIAIEKKHKIKFYYEDFRVGWKESREIARKYNLYMQKYCGCILSKIERGKF